MRVMVRSFGCSTNFADGAVLEGCLEEAGIKKADSIASADVIVLNTCAVKGPTENRMIETAKRIPLGKKLIITGCLPLVNFERLQREVSFNGVTGPAAGSKIVELVKQVSRGETVMDLENVTEDLPSLSLPRVMPSRIIDIIPVSYGCLGSCTYCCVTAARGRLRSYDPPDIESRVANDIKSGFREFWITSQDTACYGRDKKTNLAVLLRALCKTEADYRIRVGMMTPNNVFDILDDLAAAFADDHVFKFIHLPVQSGDDDVLTAMRRFYSVEEFETIVETFRANFPDITLATDVICGFPGETEDAFRRTLQLMERVKPDIVNVSKFFARPKTLATKMLENSVPLSTIKQRSIRATRAAKRLALENNRRWAGWTGQILLDEKGKVPGSLIGRNDSYKPVAIKASPESLGKSVSVKIVKPFPTYLKGTTIR